jgi:hypothetical protein
LVCDLREPGETNALSISTIEFEILAALRAAILAAVK